MPAVAERPEVKTPAEEPSWTMPPIQVGDQVCWFFAAEANRKPELCIVDEVHEKVVSVICFSRTRGPIFRESVRHINDPFLVSSAHASKNGAWDYTPSHKRQAMEMKILQARVEVVPQLETRLTKLEQRKQ